MEDREVTSILNQWDEAEMIYRDVWRMRRGEIDMEALLRRWPEENYYLQIALEPERFPDVVPAAYLLKDELNVALSKHPRYDPMPLHVHEYFEMNFVLSGCCTQRFGDGAAELSAGDLCLLSPDATHAIEAFGDDDIVLNIAIRRSTFLKRFPALPRKDSAISSFFMDNLYSKKKLRYLLVHSGDDRQIRHLLLRMYAEEIGRDRYTDDVLSALVTILFNLLLRRFGDDMEAPPFSQAQSALTDAILGYIHQHYADVTLQQVADEFHFSRQYCSRLISDLTGCSLSELVTGIRIGQGEELLLNTHLSIEKIGERLGYANPETFVRAFRRARGMTPGQFRRDGER